METESNSIPTTEKEKETGAVVVGADDGSDKEPKPKAKPGRRSKFSTAENLIIIQEVAASKAHIAPHGETMARFKEADIKANANPSFAHSVNAKSIQDRFLRLVEDFETRDAQDKVMSGVGGEIGEVDALLGDIVEARKDLETKKKGDADAKSDQEQKKLAAGREIILQSLKNKAKRGKGSSSDTDSDTPKEVTPKKRRVGRMEDQDGMAAFGEAIKASDLARCEVDREPLNLEAKKFEQEVLDRSAERAERAQERREKKEEANAQRELIHQMRKDSTKQLNAVLALVGKILESKK